MKTITTEKIKNTVSDLCQSANYILPKDVLTALKKAYKSEKQPFAKSILKEILDNSKIASKKRIALCQDTGIVEVFVRLGQNVKLTGTDLYKSINNGVRDGYRKGFLRKSVVLDPIRRKNTNTNTPVQFFTDIVPGNRLEITILPKGAGSENSSSIEMFSPTDNWEKISGFILETVKTKGIKSCPPLVIGIGIGGSFSTVGKIAKKALLRKIGSFSKDKFYSNKEKDLLKKINSTNIGPMGLGGLTTALAVNIETAPCHIASLPVAISMQCHSCRRKTAIL